MDYFVTATVVAALAVLSGSSARAQQIGLPNLALQKVLSDASPIFGDYAKTESGTSEWMKGYPDSTLLVHMNLPGTHDSATWNYTQATQNALKHVTDLNGEQPFPPQFYRCQDSPFIAMLDAGIRVFDLRFAFDPTDMMLVFYHSAALQSETATLDDVLFGFCTWLDDHPSEAVLLSLQYEEDTQVGASNNLAVQTAIFNTLTSPGAKQYFLQTKDELGTLGEARGKITLLRRFDVDALTATQSAQIPGLYFPPSLWTDNSPNITLVYNTVENLIAYIEDYYDIEAPFGSGAALNIRWKLNATTAHLCLAASDFAPDSLFWSFASSSHDVDIPSEYPEIMALGNGTQYTPLGGMNQQLVPFLQGLSGKRVGIIMFDFYETPSSLVPTLLGLSSAACSESGCTGTTKSL